VVRRLESGLGAAAPESLFVLREVSIVLGDRQRPEPDLSVVDVDAVDDELSWCPAGATHLVVEVVSPESVERDRERKPQLYARAGIAHFWRVENTDGKPVVYVYELDPATSTYSLTGIFHEKLELSVPFDLAIDLTDL
jgi:Uma2 family endonuclease